ncbi:Microtubule-binding_protein MIP-T3 [Hexamita inflata]|uniref:Microtubule-binding_protein MIP-T3 n=1 Tax=Hexamita inflata TaxID=28002 RepID=A0ABP1HFY2_9EUKA
MAEAPSQEMIEQAMQAIAALASVPSVTEKALSRPPVRVLQEIFAEISSATGFPDPAVIVRDEFPKEQKQERIDYIQNIIQSTADFLSIQIPCEAKNITAGKEVPQTLYFLIKLCEAGRLKKAQENQPAGQVETETVQMEEPQPEPKIQEQIYEPQVEEVIKPPQGLFEAEPEPQIKEMKPVFTEEPKQQKPVVDERQQALLQQQKEEEDVRQYEEIKKRQEQAEKELQMKTQQAMQQVSNMASNKPTFNAPPMSAARKREVTQVPSQEAQYKVQIVREEESEDKEDAVNATIAEQLGLDGDARMAGLFDAPVVQGDAQGAFMKDIQQTAQSFNQGIPQSSQEKRQFVQQKLSNQANSKLILAVQEAVRQVIPFSKATSFLEEHLVRMRQELMIATDDVANQEQLRTKSVNLENKNRSVLDAKLRSVQEQIVGVKAALSELAGQVVV